MFEVYTQHASPDSVETLVKRLEQYLDEVPNKVGGSLKATLETQAKNTQCTSPQGMSQLSK